MVGFNQFMSVGLTKCGSDEETFGGLVELWNREKEAIRDMDEGELQEALTCP